MNRISAVLFTFFIAIMPLWWVATEKEDSERAHYAMLSRQTADKSLVAILPSQKKSNQQNSFPHGFREWDHIKTAVNNPSMGAYSGFHHIYGNAKAIQGYRDGEFAEGSVLVFDVMEALPQANGDVIEGKRKLIDVMRKVGSTKKLTGGWVFEEYRHDGKEFGKRIDPTPAQCFECHTSQSEHDFVFSRLRP